MVIFLFLKLHEKDLFVCVCVLFLLLSCMIDFGFFVGCSQQSQCLFSGTVPVVPVFTGNIVEQNSLYSHCNPCSSVDTRIHPSLSSPFSLQEALHREQMLEQKLATLQRLLTSTQEASESSWQVYFKNSIELSVQDILPGQLNIDG